MFRTLLYSEPEKYSESCQVSIWCSVFLMNPDIFRTLVHSKPWHILRRWYIQNYVKYIRCNILFRTICNYKIFGLLKNSKLQHIQNLRHSKYHESLKYSLHRTMYNIGIFTTPVSSSPSILRTREIRRTLSCVIGRFLQNPA